MRVSNYSKSYLTLNKTIFLKKKKKLSITLFIFYNTDKNKDFIAYKITANIMSR